MAHLHLFPRDKQEGNLERPIFPFISRGRITTKYLDLKLSQPNQRFYPLPIPLPSC